MKPHACDSSRGARGVVGMRALRATAYALLLLAPLLAPLPASLPAPFLELGVLAVFLRHGCNVHMWEKN